MLNHVRLSTASGFINPTWYRACMGKSFFVTVESTGVYVEGEKLAGCSFPVGTEIRVEIDRNFYCCMKSDWDAFQAQKEISRKQKEEEDRLKSNQRREAAVNFNATIKLPVQWDISRKDVLSGLSFNSMGNGYKSSTVHHILLLEDFISGRLSRKKHDFLCTSNGDNGMNYSGSNADPVRVHDGDHNPYAPKVSCKSCLKIAHRLSLKQQSL